MDDAGVASRVWNAGRRFVFPADIWFFKSGAQENLSPSDSFVGPGSARGAFAGFHGQQLKTTYSDSPLGFGRHDGTGDGPAMGNYFAIPERFPVRRGGSHIWQRYFFLLFYPASLVAGEVFAVGNDDRDFPWRGADLFFQAFYLCWADRGGYSS